MIYRVYTQRFLRWISIWITIRWISIRWISIRWISICWISIRWISLHWISGFLHLGFHYVGFLYVGFLYVGFLYIEFLYVGFLYVEFLIMFDAMKCLPGTREQTKRSLDQFLFSQLTSRLDLIFICLGCCKNLIKFLKSQLFGFYRFSKRC